jgi:hypothetical protein
MKFRQFCDFGLHGRRSNDLVQMNRNGSSSIGLGPDQRQDLFPKIFEDARGVAGHPLRW